MPGQYAEPAGCILLAWDKQRLIGGVAVRPMNEPGFCEMKRLYLKEPRRGRGIGSRLVEDSLSFAIDAGYVKMRLDTERRLETAIRVYGKLGFREIEQYNVNPMEDMLCMEKEL